MLLRVHTPRLQIARGDNIRAARDSSPEDRLLERPCRGPREPLLDSPTLPRLAAARAGLLELMKHPDKLVEVGVNRAASVRPILFPRASVTVYPDVRRPLPRGELEPLGELGRRATCGLIVGGLLRPPKRPQTQCNADR